jgi:hypothetical protein
MDETYSFQVARELRRLRGASDESLALYDREIAEKRIRWIRQELGKGSGAPANPLEYAYWLLLKKLGITEADAPIHERTGTRIVFHSRNPCPTLDACMALGLDTRRVCRLCNERAMHDMLRQVDPRLVFSRNYVLIRPYAEFCEEIISLEP